MSRQYFNFAGLISDFSNPFTVITHTKPGYNAAGDYVPGEETRTTLKGAIIAHRENKVLRSDGAITAKDKRLFMRQALPYALIGAEVEYCGQRYRIESEVENSEFTGVWSYMLKWVSAFD